MQHETVEHHIVQHENDKISNCAILDDATWKHNIK